MRILILAWAILLVLVVPTFARSVTDHEGRTVEVPDHPQRILSLHDWTLTVMARELGAPLIASIGRPSPDGKPFMRGARELFGLTFDQVELASLHGKPDLERIRALKPDLIVANLGDFAALTDQLSSIAPTLMFNPESGKPPFALYREFAGWIGKEQRFDTLKAAYDQRLAETRARLGTSTEKTYAAILADGRDGSLTILKDYGVLTTVLDDLGFHRIPLSGTVPSGQSRMRIGAELVGEIDADMIVTTYLPENGGSPQSIFNDLDRIAPGYQDFLRAYAEKHILSFSRYEVYPTSFRGALALMDALSGMAR
ncbi:ABC transporter substrate-binding protein [Neorhizobium alkalisoli]|uniref:Iron complex transport system substrate-binding protein n=1 Tax=Neorhizobium alkalisoli TaxID=528178 RepID=A0A561R8V7_9HYPH|nr:ABC transporter substrate-binding protein [Neorhizobium alkalisoli]TWF59065.1 iron complex transport system substrate-binding protein [Neorhizobium alkalisoli]